MLKPELLAELEKSRVALMQDHKLVKQKTKDLEALIKALKKATGSHTEKAGDLERVRVSMAQDQKPLKQRNTELDALIKALKKAADAFTDTSIDPIGLSKAIEVIQSNGAVTPAIRELQTELSVYLERAQEQLSQQFGEQLRASFASQQIEVGGRPPKFEVGRFLIETDFTKRKVIIFYGKIELTRLGLSVPQTIVSYHAAMNEIMKRDEDGQLWIAQFYEAWEAARRLRGTSDLRVNIIDCYFELFRLRQKKTFRYAPTRGGLIEYTPAQFSHDFYEFAEVRRLSAEGKKVFPSAATKQQTGMPDRHLWIVEGENPNLGRFIGDIKFDRDE
jgi:hypothetical protein